MTLETGISLYRYSLGDNMPEEWQADFHNIEYDYPGIGPKNQVGAFFFYPNKETAHKVLKVAIGKMEAQGRHFERNTITRCSTTAEIRLLDLTTCTQPVDVLYTLYNNEIDILDGSFIKKLDVNTSQNLSDIRNAFENITTNRQSIDVVNAFFYSLVGYIGQLLTDFENGSVFKKLLYERHYEGYAFQEEPTSPTICIFDSAKLSLPHHTII